MLFSRLLAGDEGIEPPPKVLETPIIPLDQSPIFNISTLSSVLYYYMNEQIKLCNVPSELHTDEYYSPSSN